MLKMLVQYMVMFAVTLDVLDAAEFFAGEAQWSAGFWFRHMAAYAFELNFHKIFNDFEGAEGYLTALLISAQLKVVSITFFLRSSA